MHIVFLNQYYPPDAAPTGVMLEAVVEQLAAQGHQVTVICAEGGYAGGRRKTARRKTQEEEAGRDGFTYPSHLSPAACGEKRSKEERHDPPGGGRAAPDEVGRLRKGDPTMIRIGATRFGRGTFVGKLMDYLSYYLGVAWRLAWMVPRPDRVVALTTPPYLSVLARALSKLRGADHAHWVMDVYPDVMLAHGMLREDSLRYHLLAALARWGWGGKRCAAVVTLGPDMAERLRELLGIDGPGGRPTCPQRGDGVGEKDDPAFAGRPTADQVGRLRNSGPTLEKGGRKRQSDPVWVPLWGGPADGAATTGAPDPVRELRRKRGWKDREMIVMYSGNMGLGHRFGEILALIGRDGLTHPSHLSPSARGDHEAACGGRAAPDEVGRLRKGDPTGDEVGRLRESDPARFVFFGGGKRRGEIAEFMAANPGCPVELHDYVPREHLAVHLQTADVHLVSLEPSWTGTMLPSKLQGIFAVARPVVFIGDEQSSLARWIRESGGGWVVKPGDVAGLQAAIEEASSPRVRHLRGRAAQAFAMAHFDRDTNSRQVAEWLQMATSVSLVCFGIGCAF